MLGTLSPSGRNPVTVWLEFIPCASRPDHRSGRSQTLRSQNGLRYTWFLGSCQRRGTGSRDLLDRTLYAVRRRKKPASHLRSFHFFTGGHRLLARIYVRYPLSRRNVEDLLFERGIDICHETVRLWWNRFGPLLASDIRRQRISRMKGLRHWRWHLDEMYVKINGGIVYLWRAADQKGQFGYAVLNAYVVLPGPARSGNRDRQRLHLSVSGVDDDAGDLLSRLSSCIGRLLPRKQFVKRGVQSI